MSATLFIHREVVSQISAVPARPFEVGGWLLGYWAEEAQSVFVTHATPPASIGTPFGVTISGKGHRQRFDAAWDRTDGAVTYLGDWHTHPGSPPRPSQQDAKALQQLARSPRFATPTPLMGIVSTPRWPWSHDKYELALYIRRSDDRIENLVPRVVDELPAEVRVVPNWKWPVRRELQPS